MSASIPWELLLVDNKSSDQTAQVIRNFILKAPVPSQYLFVDRPGNGAGRNAAILASRGDIIAFTDDDCYVDQKFLDQISRVFDDPKVGYMSGRIMLFDRLDYPITINEGTEPIFLPPKAAIRPGIVQGANMAFRRNAVISSGLFDPNFGAGTQFSGEDWELAMRVSADGWAGGYYPGPIVWHHHRRKEADFKRLFRYYAVGEGAVYGKGLLAPSLRGAIAILWAKSIGRDVIKTGSLHHFWLVLYGALRYWRARFKGDLLLVDEAS